MADEKTQTRKPRQSRKPKTANAKTNSATQVTAATSKPNSEQPQVIGHYQAVFPPTSDPIAIDVPNEPKAMDIVLSCASQSSGDDSKAPFLIHVKSQDKQRGFWRCALFFSPEGCTLTVESNDGQKLSAEDGSIVTSITLEQYQRLIDEPRLIVEVL